MSQSLLVGFLWRLTFLCVCVCVCVYASVHARARSVMSDLATPWTVACQAPLSMGFSRQEHWSELLFPPPGDLPYPGIEPGSPAFLPLYRLTFLGPAY